MAKPAVDKNAVKLTEAEREQRWPNRRPVDAATLILIDPAGSEPQVLMGRRDKSLKFMPGKFVFPGGRIDRTDRQMAHCGQLNADTRQRLLNDMKGTRSEARATALALAAIRETYEETGILIGTKGTLGRCPKGEWQGFATHGVVPDVSALTFIARAVTPPRRPRRFDTRFFAATTDAIGHQLPFAERPHQELGELQWIPISEAGRLDLPTITTVIIGEVAARLGRGPLAAAQPVPYYYMRNKVFLRKEL